MDGNNQKSNEYRITLKKDAWEEGTQTVESENFIETGYFYTVEPEAKRDMVQWTQCEISAVSVEDGEMVFMYEGTAPTADIKLLVKGEMVDEEEKIDDSAVVIVSNATLGEDNEVIFDPAITYEDIKAIIEEGKIPLWSGIWDDNENKQGFIEAVNEYGSPETAYELIIHVDTGTGEYVMYDSETGKWIKQ